MAHELRRTLLFVKRFAGVLAVLLILPLAAFGEPDSRFGLGINYPGAGIRYWFNDRYTVEARAQIESHIMVSGVRLYRYLNLNPRMLFFLGTEADYISLKGTDSTGDGYAGGFFGGAEYFFSPRVSMQCDLGPAYISVRDKDTALSVGGVEFLVNVGVNFYFSPRTHGESTVK